MLVVHFFASVCIAGVQACKRADVQALVSETFATERLLFFQISEFQMVHFSAIKNRFPFSISKANLAFLDPMFIKVSMSGLFLHAHDVGEHALFPQKHNDLGGLCCVPSKSCET